MRVAEKLLYSISKRSKSPVRNRLQALGDDATSDHYNLNYALKKQYDGKVINGTSIDIRDKRILEIGCGHGGICLYCGLNGAKAVVGLDIDDFRLSFAEQAVQVTCDRFGMDRTSLPVQFTKMSAYEMTFAPSSFDLILADNVFEHFMEPEKVMEQCFKILKPGGKIVVRSMPSYYSKYGIHLKNGLKVPWANLFFSEKTICNVMIKLAEENPKLLGYYPGIKNKPDKIKDLRASGDLNGITYGKFRNLARKVGFVVQSFKPHYTPRIMGLILSKTPIIKNSFIMDILSVSSSSVLQKPV